MDFDHQAGDEGGSAAVNLSQFPCTTCQVFPRVTDDMTSLLMIILSHTIN